MNTSKVSRIYPVETNQAEYDKQVKKLEKENRNIERKRGRPRKSEHVITPKNPHIVNIMNSDTPQGQVKENTNEPVTKVVDNLPVAKEELKEDQKPKKDIKPTTDQQKFNDPESVIDVPKIEQSKGGQSGVENRQSETLNFVVKKDIDGV